MLIFNLYKCPENKNLIYSWRKQICYCLGPKGEKTVDGKGTKEKFLRWENVLYFDCGYRDTDMYLCQYLMKLILK
jgi:hypothetical protein